MNLPKRCTAIKSLLLMLALGLATSAHAAANQALAAGIVTNLSGPLFVNKADGSVRVLGVQSTVEAGDTLSTQGRGYAKIRFSDDSLLTVQPDTVVTLDKYYYHPAAPAVDELFLTLKQGGVRSDVGQIGRRSPDRVILGTPLGRIALQSATALVQYMPETGKVAVIGRFSQPLALLGADLQASTVHSDGAYGVVLANVAARYSYRLAHMAAWLESRLAEPLSSLAAVAPGPGASAALPPGLYVLAIDGMIRVTNPAGSLSFTPGQFGFTPNFNQPPAILPKDPGLKFSPPPTFNSSTGPLTGTSSATRSNSVDCEVR